MGQSRGGRLSHAFPSTGILNHPTPSALIMTEYKNELLVSSSLVRSSRPALFPSIVPDHQCAS